MQCVFCKRGIIQNCRDGHSSTSGSKGASQLPLIDGLDVQMGTTIIWLYELQQSLVVDFFSNINNASVAAISLLTYAHIHITAESQHQKNTIYM